MDGAYLLLNVLMVSVNLRREGTVNAGGTTSIMQFLSSPAQRSF